MIRNQSEYGKNFTGNDLYFGYCVDLMEKISTMLNISYELRHVKDNKFGAKGCCICYKLNTNFKKPFSLFCYSSDENGEWNGMVGELVRNEAGK